MRFKAMPRAVPSPSRIYPVILSGGSGTRLWPLSTAGLPKQFLAMTSPATLFEDTVRRVTDTGRFHPPLIVCNHEHRFIVAEQLRGLGFAAQAIVLEPEGRNTAPAAAVAAIWLADRDPDALMLVLPSDHLIRRLDRFLAAVDAAAAAARAGYLVTFGTAPARPETGYGYIHRGASLPDALAGYRVQRFVEKPDRATAERLLAMGDHFWNSGIFLFGVKDYLTELSLANGDLLEASRAALANGRRDLDFFRLNAAAFAACRNVSIDVAVMERTAKAAVIPVDMGWSDVGSWSALWQVADRDPAGNVLAGQVLTADTENCYIRSEGPPVAAIGLRDQIVVVTRDAALVMARDRAEAMKGVIEMLKAKGQDDEPLNRVVHRPWGTYQTLHLGERFRVKAITVKPGAKLSLQMHRHRAEHWVIVKGTARITRGDEVLLLEADQSTYIPLGSVHRLENPMTDPLELIEVQSGAYIGEDDIVRLDDDYGRILHG